MQFKCCDCGEDFDTQSLLEQHISVEHLSWSPYWCLYCKQNRVTLKKATKDALKLHVEKIHPSEQFLFIYEPDDAKEEEHRNKMNRSLALPAQVDTAHHSLLSPAPTPVSPSTTSALDLEPKLEPFEESEFQLPASNSNDTGWQFSSPLGHCLTCGAQISNDGQKHECQFPDIPVDSDIKQEVSYQLGELFSPESSLINSEPTPTPNTLAKKNKFQCTVCGKEYGKKEPLRAHEDTKMHWGLLKHLARLKCDLCPVKFHRIKNLQLHRKTVHKADPQPLPPSQKTVACRCRKKFTAESQLLLHQDHRQHHPKSAHKRLRKCPMCSKKYHFKGILEQHMRIHNKGKMKESQPNSRNVRLHCPPSMSECKLCSQKIPNNRASKKEHAKVHFSRKLVFKCSMCPKQYGRLATLRSHEDLKMHWGTLKHLAEYHCKKCNCTFHYPHTLRMHKEMIDHDDHERKEEPASLPNFPKLLKAVKVQCQMCDRVFRHEAGLSKHGCPGKPSYRCKLCKQEFDNLETLDLHRENYNHHEAVDEPVQKLIVKDQMEKPKLKLEALKCKHCRKQFTSKEKLKKHQEMLMKSKLLSVKVGLMQRKQGDKHLMAKLCIKKCVKLF